LHSVASVSKDSERRQAAECPCNVVYQDIFWAEDDGWSEDGVGNSGCLEFALQDCFAVEVFERRIVTGVCDAGMNNSLDAGGFGCCKEG
tara:strand:- start:409 stop:675 length:267 start_codon:yes stop_codon:yes gene_type:complete